MLNCEQLLRDDQIETLFSQDLNTALTGAKTLIPGWDSLSVARKRAITDLAYNVGVAGLAKFLRLIAAINTNDWEAAEKEIKNSLYYSQVGVRGRRNAAAIRHGDI